MLFEDMCRILQKMKKSYPDQMRLNIAGVSGDKREIWEAEIGDKEAPYHILLHGAIHGREYMNTELILWMICTYLQNIQRKDYEAACLHILPMVNPDGVCISREGPCAIRSRELRQILWECYQRDRNVKGEGLEAAEYFKKWKANARGVDLNKNFPYGWKEYQGSAHPSSAFYKGETPGSEEETKAVLKLSQLWSFCCTIAFHSSGELIYWDYGSKGKVFEQEKQLAEQISVITGYEMRSTVAEGTEKAGSSDYFVRHCKIPSVTIETGSAECPLPGEEFLLMKKRHRHFIRDLIQYFRSGIACSIAENG